jgi:Mlc titration factor MtfA (ptsG expression regulator)
LKSGKQKRVDEMQVWTVLFALAAGLAVPVAVGIRRLRLKRLLAAPPPPGWRPLLQQTVPVIDRLSDAQLEQLFGRMQVFLAEKKFEGCGGQEITEEIRVTIAAQACMLLLGRKTRIYPRLKTILVYPHTYTGGHPGLFGGETGSGARLGESWGSGVVVLSWDSVRGGALNFEDGHNVTFHEFAHQLDQEDGAADGAPVLPARSAYATWARVFSREYEALLNKARRGKRDIMDRYGTANPAEFFAVATETFFEKPRQLYAKHPELFEELRSFYRLDPRDWTVR